MSRLSAGRRPARRFPTVGVLVSVLLSTGCGGSDREAGTAEPAAADVSGEVSGEVVVLAAASLTESFTELAEGFEETHPGTTVTPSFEASSTLAQQVVAGAPADVFASADTATMRQVVDAGMAAGTPAVFVRNRLQIATPSGNPAGVTGLADFADPELALALCAPEVPCGAATARAFDAAGLRPRPDTLEEDVRATLTKVQLGEVDAALVYRTDVAAASGQVDGIDFRESARAVNDYPIVTLADAPNPAGAEAFVAYLLDAGQQVLSDAGFEHP